MAEGQPMELKEYEYRVGHLPVTAMLTEKMAERLDAKPVGESTSEGVGAGNEADRMSTHGRETDDAGVADGDGELRKSRSARNKRAS